MVLEIDYLNLLPKEYKKALKKLNKKLETTTTFSAKNCLLKNFVKKFTTLPKIYDYWFDLVCTAHSEEILTWNGKEIHESNQFDFPALKFNYNEWPNYQDYYYLLFRTCIINNKEALEKIETMISLPHSKLKIAYDGYLENIDTVISKEKRKKYQKSCEIYQEMLNTDIKSGKEFIEILMKTQNTEFIINNIEIRLAKNPWNQNLWKAYIEYVENTKNHSIDLLEILSRYCRLFVGDKEMKEKYQEKIEILSETLDDIARFWIDLIKYEFQFNFLKAAAIKLLEKALKTSMTDKMKFFSLALNFADNYRLQDGVYKMINEAKEIYLMENPKIIDESYKRILKPQTCKIPQLQKLPFNIAVNLHILENFDYSHLRKLYQTSKYFYYKYRFNLVHKLEVKNNYYLKGRHIANIPSLNYSKDSLNITPHDSNKYQNIWLTNCLKISGIRLIMPKILSKVVKSSLKALYLFGYVIILKEFNILNESKSIEKLGIYSGRILYEENNPNQLPLTEILSYLPNLRRLVSSKHYQPTPETIEKLISLDFVNKLEIIDLRFNGNLDGEGFYDFFEKNLSSNAYVNIYVHNGNQEDVKIYLEEKFNLWCSERKPILSWKSNTHF